MSIAYTIRGETQHDYNQISRLHQEAFGQDMEARLVQALRNNKQVFIPELSLVAVATDQTIIGHILFTPIDILCIEGNMVKSLSLAPMAVRPEFQKQGIGSQLVITGLKIAKEMDFTSIFVLGHPMYYPKFGFQPAQQWHITSPFSVPNPVFMALELSENALRNISGTLIYPQEFDLFAT